MRTIPIDLPSRGFLGTPSEVEMREMNLNERKSLMDRPPFTKMVSMVGDLITSPASFAVKELSLSDYLYLMVKMRTLSMGSNYIYPVTCSSCGRSIMVETELDELEILEASPDSGPTFTVDINADDDDEEPCNYEISYLTVEDQITINKRLRRKKASRKKFKDSDEYLFTLAYRIKAINDLEIKEPERITDELGNLESHKVDILEDAIASHDFGLRLVEFVESPKCGFSGDYPVQITPEFFFRRRELGKYHRLHQ